MFSRLLLIIIIIIIIIKGKREFCNTALMCSLTQVVYYERNIGLIHTREEKPNLLYKQERSGFWWKTHSDILVYTSVWVDKIRQEASQNWSQIHLDRFFACLFGENVIVCKGLELYQKQSNLGQQIVFVFQERYSKRWQSSLTWYFGLHFVS